jgi:hypothetical protein
MKLLRSMIPLCCVLALAGAVAGADNKQVAKDAGDVKDLIEGKWQGVKGTFTAKDTLTFKRYAAFQPGTAGDYTFTERRSNLVGPGGKKLPPTDITVGTGSYSLDGNKLTLSPGALPGPLGKDKVVWKVAKVTKDSLVLTTDKGKTEEFKKVR